MLRRREKSQFGAWALAMILSLSLALALNGFFSAERVARAQQTINTSRGMK